MLTVAIDTSTRLGSVGVGRSGELLGETSFSARATHSETVLPEVRRLLDRCGEGPGSVEAVVVGAGPGSFTGVRIAAALGKGLCAARRARLFAYSSLEAVAVGTGLAGRICVLFDARREQVYAAAWDVAPPAGSVLGPVAASLEEVLSGLDEVGSWCFAGDGAMLHRQALEARGARVLSSLHAFPRAGALLRLAAVAPDRGRVAEPSDWEPTYARASGAERGV
ncbi:MAG: tRNA (adenosine(37)-N6)-threonylcarbamoyltransferase complex dimerization subunit type 1 TsaB [Candidatus Palauibacterales bacterium]|nr:tRNA (adenosine(37)-N6)-threonylcarbamoyltransferase complex dimerization subunit type 1 TsaB [Candidatus Palauibacterales bacterium]MDP2530314.1 tRNA (adenosine(37)-N6)-threonylcarbamoyltransferase complex dimerization subunit type 1 TsaB [Candidatus Palauibacterales bacterium]MDP2583099.1 tRNA (adenosine(37)-N6)-threonylcarbamoyltransferase complex dimerization subunit type 1 TsaB [Candidatus Palauibacterales bacterium]